MTDICKTFANWAVCDNKTLQTTISISNGGAGDTIEDVTAERCVCLIPPPDAEAVSKPEIKLALKRPFSQIDIISEAQIVEFFGNSDEYISTCHAEFLDDWEGMAVYHAVITTAPFTRAREPDRLWIYAINVRVCEESSSMEQMYSMPKGMVQQMEESAMPIFNPNNISKLLEKSGHQISEKAERFKNFVQLYSSKGGETSKHLSPQILLKMLESQYGSELQDCKRTMSECLLNFQTPKVDDGIGKREKSEERNAISPSHQELKTYLDERLQRLESNLMEHIDRRFVEMTRTQADQFDKMVTLLEKIERASLK